MEYYLTVISTMIILCEMIMTDDIAKWSPDENGVCTVLMNDNNVLNCPISKVGKLPNLTSVDDNGNDKEWVILKLWCKSSSSRVYDINLTSSVFGENFRAEHYIFDFYHCNFNLSPNLFDNVIPYDVNSIAEYSLELSLESYIPNLYFNNASTRIAIERYSSGDMDKLKRALEQSNVVILRLDYRSLKIPARFFTGMTGLKGISVKHISLCQSYAFWKLPDLDSLEIYADDLLSKALYKIGHIQRLYLNGPLTSLQNGSIHTISSIITLELRVNRDAFEGQTFHNVTSIDNLYLFIYPNWGPNCSRTSAECDVVFDFRGTKTNYMRIITMNEVLFTLPSSDLFSSLPVSELSIEIRMIEKYTTDQWVDGSFIQDAIKGVSTLSLSVRHKWYDGRRINSVTCFPLNFTSSVLKTVWYEIKQTFRNPVCDSSWLTLPSTTDNVTFKYYAKMERIPYPLIIRSAQLSGTVRLSIGEDGPSTKFVHCTCSISWLKQLMDCDAVHLDRTWLDLPCFSDRSMTVQQFLNSTICCNSTDRPTLNNEPNMPMKCNQFLPIPPELLYFNHADLPQCRNSSTNYWEFNPCNVSAFYRKYILDKAQSEVGPSGNEANSVTNAANNSVTNATNNSVINATQNSVIVMVLLMISATANIALIVACLCCWKRLALKSQHNRFLAWRSNLVISEDEKMQYVDAINNNVDAIASVINLEKMTKRGRNKMILDDCGEEIPLIAGNDFNDINELDHSAHVIQFLEKIETKSVVVIRWFLIQLIRDGHNNIVERIVDEVKSKKVDPEENKVGDMELDDL